jgi:hypothetical protein
MTNETSKPRIRAFFPTGNYFETDDYEVLDDPDRVKSSTDRVKSSTELRATELVRYGPALDAIQSNIDESLDGSLEEALRNIADICAKELPSPRTRRALVYAPTGYDTVEGVVKQISASMPANYKVVGYDANGSTISKQVVIVLIEGSDYAGWTLDDYVIPRLGSGLYACHELKEI